MPLIPIQAIDDPRLAQYRDLRGKQTAQRLGLFVAEGVWLVERLLASPVPVHSVLVEEQHLHRVVESITEDIDVFVALNGTLDEVLGFRFHRGVVACGYRPKATSWQSIAEREGPLRILVCNQVCDPENLGGVIRNASAFGIDAVIVDSSCGDVFSRRVARVSMGTFLQVPIDIVTDLGSTIESMQRDFQIDVYATVLDESAEPISDVPPAERLALVFGNEGHGIAADLVQASTRRITLPMKRGADSLNVATSVGVFLYHFS